MFSRKSALKKYSPSGTKLNEERNPLRVSNAANWATRDSPLAPSTSWGSTKANGLPPGHRGHRGGWTPAFASIGQVPEYAANRDLARCRRRASRTDQGRKGFRK